MNKKVISDFQKMIDVNTPIIMSTIMILFV